MYPTSPSIMGKSEAGRVAQILPEAGKDGNRGDPAREHQEERK